MDTKNNCPLCGQTVGPVAYVVVGKAQLCVKHWAERHRQVDGAITFPEPTPFQKRLLDALMDPAIERVTFAGRTTPIAATQPPIDGK